MTSLSRRRFLKITASALAAAGVAGKLGGAVADRVTKVARSGVRKIPTFCDVCFWKCGAIAYVRDGRLWKIEGNPADPLSRGRLCPRGTGGVGAHYDRDRLRAPLIRVSRRGEDQWQEVTWDEAFDYIAQRMQRIKAEHGAEAMALFAHGLGGGFFRHVFKAFGSPNMAEPAFAQCRGARDVGFELTFGDVVGSPERTDIANTDCLVLIGSHLGEYMHNTPVQEFAAAVGRGASIIVVDPRVSVAASKAKYYLPIRPGTDLALLLAWMHVIVKEGLYDREYVAKYGYGFAQFAASLETCTPEWAYPETGIEPGIIRATAREMARYRPATLVHPGRHVNWYGNDAQRSRAIALLNALLGSWGRRGGLYVPAGVEVPPYPYPAYPQPARPPADNPDKKFPFAGEALTNGLRDATLTGQPYPIKGWFVYATDLIYSLPDQAATIRALQQLDLVVVVDVVPSEIAGWADVVLPENVYLERYDDLSASQFREPFIALRQPVVDAPQDQKPGWWIARRLAQKLDLGAWFPWKDIEGYLDHRLRAAGHSLEELKREGIVRGPAKPIYFEDGAPAEFYTPSGKIEFYSPQLQQAGFDPVPRYTPPEAGPPGAFRLLCGRTPVHTFSRTQTNPILADLMSENAVWVNAVAARRLGFKNGDYVRLRNQDGIVSNRVRIKVTARVRPDCVFLVHGFGHTARGLRRAYLKGASDAQLESRYRTDPLMGATGINVNFVTLEPEA